MTTDPFVAAVESASWEADRHSDDTGSWSRLWFRKGAEWARSYLAADRRTAQPHPLTPDDITDEMVERAHDYWGHNSIISRDGMRGLLTAALTEPPARPEGAEELARLIADADVGEWDCGDLADALLTTGRVRVIPKEDPR